MTDPGVTGALAGLVEERAEQLGQLADKLRAHGVEGVLPEHRVLQLAATLLATLGDLDEQVARLSAWLDPARGSSA